ncbi:endonuclease III domain-containing protein [Chloroflexota bacterium]
MFLQNRKNNYHSSDRGNIRVIKRINTLLLSEYGSPRLGNPEDPLNDLVFLLLSPRTRYESHMRVYFALKEVCPDFSQLQNVSKQTLIQCVKESGLSKQKVERLIACMYDIEKKNGIVSLDNLKTMSEINAETFLRSLSGVGVKIARCVMMYTLGHKVFPVDINVFRILSRIRLIEKMDFKRDLTHDTIQQLIPRKYRYDLHVNLVMHGRTTCLVRKPKCNQCVINDQCKFAYNV